jgi:hypothetical protein
MKRAIVFDHLADCERQVAEGMERIKQQRDVLTELYRHGYDARNAETLLRVFIAAQEIRFAEMRRLHRACRQLH